MYHVIVKKFIAECEDEYGLKGKNFYYHLVLPFPPSIGLTISTSGWFCSEILSVNWEQRELSGQGYFTCSVAAEEPYKYDGHNYDFKYLCDSALNGFWIPYDKAAKKTINAITVKPI